MSECAECGALIADDHNFCTACGARVPVPAGAAPTPWGSYVATPATTAPAPDYRPPGSGYAPPGQPYPVPPYLPPQKPAVRKGLLIALGVIVGLFVLLNIAAALDPVEDNAPTYDYDDIDFGDAESARTLPTTPFEPVNPVEPMNPVEPVDPWDGWVVYEDPDGAFRAEFPSDPEVTHDEWSPLPDINSVPVTALYADGGTYWVDLEHYEMPPGTTADAPAVAEQAARYYVEVLEGTIDDVGTEITWEGRVGYLLTMRWKDEGGVAYQSVVRAIVDGDSLYILSTSGVGNNPDAGNHFIGGFEPLGSLVPSPSVTAPAA
jgi:hypothetical protein